jgi:hypothetical protein
MHTCYQNRHKATLPLTRSEAADSAGVTPPAAVASLYLDGRYRDPRHACGLLTDEDLRAIERGAPGSPLPAFIAGAMMLFAAVVYFG